MVSNPLRTISIRERELRWSTYFVIVSAGIFLQSCDAEISFQIGTVLPTPTIEKSALSESEIRTNFLNMSHGTEVAPSINQISMSPQPDVLSDLVIPTPPDLEVREIATRFRKEGLKGDFDAITKSSRKAVEGDRRSFWILLESGAERINAIAIRSSNNAVWWFDDQVEVEIQRVDKAIAEFEQNILPMMFMLFGGVDNPGIDGDHRVHVVHTTIRGGLAGYFNVMDAFPRTLMEYSNEGQFIYMSSDYLEVGSPGYLSTLTHELQHAVHFAFDRGEEAWVNEGLSEIAANRAGYGSLSSKFFLSKPDTQLNSWPNEGSTASSYGAAQSFLAYLISQYGGDSAIPRLIAEPRDGLEGIDAYLESAGYTTRALDVFSDWVASNYLQGPTGRFVGGADPIQTTRIPVIKPGVGEERAGQVEQLAADYYSFKSQTGNVLVKFLGESEARILPVDPFSDDACWWSNSGDSIDSILEREFDLNEVSSATLFFKTWYSIEEGWDYAYVSASTDNGQTWDLLAGQTTTTKDPNGNSYGHGFTGDSNGWVEEEFDLTPYTDNSVKIRLEYVTDAAVNIHGICIDDIQIPEIAFFDDAESNSDWKHSGFVRVGKYIPQQWGVQILRKGLETSSNVERMEVRIDGAGEIIVSDINKNEEVGIVVSAMSPKSILSSRYRIIIENLP